ncbi:hypothetical protein Egran_05683 [Elaphomyces granulatus]|uniref:WHIM1 domain-containing protein n=1 Tax=Elaphomyces granulatus TaxID=519963 RepID=A0A232LQV9_9EURO|nr:hypothetical protein Egran_05683 [Elaphomyces granulatus]
MSLSDSSSLSSAPSTEDESVTIAVERTAPITKYFKQQSPPPPKRAASPPHEYVLADNSDIAFIVMFRARFGEVFPKSLPHYGPQDIEKGVADSAPGDHVERLLCALVGLVLNRKKDVEYDSPFAAAYSFLLRLLKTLVLWSLSSSDAVQTKIKESYKQVRHDDDLNQPLSVQSWGRDELKRRYWLIEGQDDTHFQLYRESNPALKTNTWWSVAGSIPELKVVADNLERERSQHSKRLSEKIKNAIPRFEGSEEKRKRRDYRLARKVAFARPEPGFSLYEGRTRGKKLKYTYSDDEDMFSDALPSTRRSTRNASGGSTPADSGGPVFTASGRQVRARAGGIYGESMLSGQRKGDLASAPLSHGGDDDAGRPQRNTRGRANGWTKESFNYVDEMDEESEAASSGNEWKGGDDEYRNEFEGDDEEESSQEEPMLGGEAANPSLVVQLRYGKGRKANGQKIPGKGEMLDADAAMAEDNAAADLPRPQHHFSTTSTQEAVFSVLKSPEQKISSMETLSLKDNSPNGAVNNVQWKVLESHAKIAPENPPDQVIRNEPE